LTIGTVFSKKVWLGARRSAIEESHDKSQSQKKSLKRETQIQAGLQGPLAIGSVSVGGSWNRGKNASLEREESVKHSLKSLAVVGGDETLSEE
jgi:hypothetical protein